MLPQVLAGLGFISFVSAGCLVWLERLQVFFFLAAGGSFVYQLWLVSRRRAVLRNTKVRMILASSLVLNLALIGGWILMAVRYR